MTPEQLDKIKRMAERWQKFGTPKGGAEDLAEHSLALVHALMDARAEIERLKDLVIDVRRSSRDT